MTCALYTVDEAKNKLGIFCCYRTISGSNHFNLLSAGKNKKKVCSTDVDLKLDVYI